MSSIVGCAKRKMGEENQIIGAKVARMFSSTSLLSYP